MMALLAGGAQGLEIRNQALRIACDQATGTVALSVAPDGQVFFRGGFVPPQPGQKLLKV